MPGSDSATPHLAPDRAIMADGATLPLRTWPASGDPGQPRAVVLALHGFTDYSRGWAALGEHLAARGIVTYAYDQRGFGDAPHPGIWPGQDKLIADLETVLRLLARRYPETPIILAGESMGAAVAMVARRQGVVAAADGLILAAPATWGWQTLNPLYAAALWTAAHSVPGWQPPTRLVRRQATDNPETVAQLRADPRVLDDVRIDMTYGLVQLMTAAYDAAADLSGPALILYGAHDTIVPAQVRQATIKRLPAEQSVVVFPQGHHLLFRDRRGDVVQRTTARWIAALIGDQDAAPASSAGNATSR